LARIKNNLYSKRLRIPAIITYYNNIRSLKETEANCTLQNDLSDSKYQYLCEIYEETKNIKQIRVVPEFDFVTQENVTVIGISPIAKMFMGNIQNIDERYNLISNSTVYILDNSTYFKYDELLFNISGSIDGQKPKLSNKSLTLHVNLESETKLEEDIDCIVTNILGDNYSLYCKANETILGDLQSAVSFVDDSDILLVNFDKKAQSIIDIEKENEANKTTQRFYTRFYYSKKTGALKSGVIIAIVIIFIVIIAIIIAIIYYIKKKPKIPNNSIESTIINLNKSS